MGNPTRASRQASVSSQDSFSALSDAGVDDDTAPDDLFEIPAKRLAAFYSPKNHAMLFEDLLENDPRNLFRLLHTHPTSGIHLREPKQYKNSARYRKYGDNSLPQRPTKSFLALVCEAFEDKTMQLLTLAAVVSFVLGLYEIYMQPPQYDPEGNKIRKVDWIEGVAIMFAVLVVVIVGAANDYQKELQFHKLNEKKENRTLEVIRNNKEVMVSIHSLLVGDILPLSTGDVVPADCVLFQGECEVDESSITGESETLTKFQLSKVFKHYKKTSPTSPDEEYDCLLLSGSKLTSGLGKAVVTAVGTQSIYGQTMASLNVETEDTPLQKRLSQLTDSISVYGCVIAIVLFILLFVRFLFNIIPEKGRFHDLDPAQKGSKFMDIFITAVTVIVVVVPEGLPLAVTLALAFATTRMTKDGNLVRVLKSCETMGSATAICSDKTGTLTTNIMTVVQCFFFGKRYKTSGDDICRDMTPIEELLETKESDALKSSILTNITLNSTAFENKEFLSKNDSDRNSVTKTPDTNHAENKNWLQKLKSCFVKKSDDDEDEMMNQVAKGRNEPYIGSKTDTALLRFAQKYLGLEFGELKRLRQEPLEKLNVKEIVQVIPFESSRKWSGIVAKYEDDEGVTKYTFFIKGAAEIVLERCHSLRDEDGLVHKLNETKNQSAAESIKQLATNSLRAISLAHREIIGLKEWPPKEIRNKDDPTEAIPEDLLNYALNGEEDQGMILDGLLGIQDPLREGVKGSIGQCQRAGVMVRMVTGDNLLTAKSIARDCGILPLDEFDDDNSSMEGVDFRDLTEEQRMKILPKLKVLARSSPEDKRLLVQALKRMHEVVAVTGDGTNDAPALKLANIGFSMGIAGTEVAREASDIILMTDDFSAIVNAIKWGRCVSVSIKKFIQFQLIVNVTAVTLTFFTSLLSAEQKSVLTAVQLLWVNLIMDTLAALALATDKPDKNIMDKKPEGKKTPLITYSTWKMILCQALLQLAVTSFWYFRGSQLFFNNSREGLSAHQLQQLNAMIFNTFVWLQFFTLIVSRKLDEADGIKDWNRRITAKNLNFFQDITRNYYFLFIIFIIGVFQVFIMFYGGVAFSIAPQTKRMWFWAVFSGMLSLPVGMFIRIVPDEWAIKIFPTRLFRAARYILGLEFMPNFRNGKHMDEEALLGGSAGSSSDEDDV